MITSKRYRRGCNQESFGRADKILPPCWVFLHRARVQNVPCAQSIYIQWPEQNNQEGQREVYVHPVPRQKVERGTDQRDCGQAVTAVSVSGFFAMRVSTGKTAGIDRDRFRQLLGSVEVV